MEHAIQIRTDKLCDISQLFLSFQVHFALT